MATALRRPPQLETVPHAAGHFLFNHAYVSQIARLARPDKTADVMLLLRIMSDANQRWLDGTVNGPTGVEDTAELATLVGYRGAAEDLAEQTAHARRRINDSIAYLSREDVGVIEAFTVTEALEKGLLRKVRRSQEKDLVGPTKEGAPRDKFGVVLRVRTEVWDQLPSAATIAAKDAAAEAAAAEAEQEEMDLQADADAPVVRLNEAPIIASRKLQSMPLSQDVRRAVQRIASVGVIAELPIDVRCSFILDGTELQCHLAGVPKAEKGPEILKSPAHSKGLTPAMLADSIRQTFARGGLPLDSDHGYDLARAFSALPLPSIDDFCGEMLDIARQKSKRMAYSLLKKHAKSFLERFESAEQAKKQRETEAARPDPERDAGFLAEYRKVLADPRSSDEERDFARQMIAELEAELARG